MNAETDLKSNNQLINLYDFSQYCGFQRQLKNKKKKTKFCSKIQNSGFVVHHEMCNKAFNNYA